jgi:hypothetical protein
LLFVSLKWDYLATVAAAAASIAGAVRPASAAIAESAAAAAPVTAAAESTAAAATAGRHLTADDGRLAAGAAGPPATPGGHVLQHRGVLEHVRQDQEPGEKNCYFRTIKMSQEIFGRDQCCGSGSGAFLAPGSGMEKSGSGMNIPDHFSKSLETVFGGKILKSLNAYPGNRGFFTLNSGWKN